MPILDMSLEELKKYKGINPKPEDFDDYWERALNELDKQSLEYILEKENINISGVECYHLYFIGVGGARIHCKFLKPANISGKIPAVAMFHGYENDSGDWFLKMPYAYNNMVVAAMDVRGQSGLSEDNLVVKGGTLKGHIIRGVDEENPDKLAFRYIYLDTVQVVRILMSMDFVDETRIGVMGLSQGGGLSLACAALEPRVKIASVGVPFLCDFKRVWEMDLDKKNTAAYQEISSYLRLKDPKHEKADAFWERLGYIDLQHLAERVNAYTVFFTGLNDEICPPSTQFAAYNKIIAEKSMVIYPDYGHEVMPGYYDDALEIMLEL